jgi:hypothetical protein
VRENDKKNLTGKDTNIINIKAYYGKLEDDAFLGTACIDKY